MVKASYRAALVGTVAAGCLAFGAAAAHADFGTSAEFRDNAFNVKVDRQRVPDRTTDGNPVTALLGGLLGGNLPVLN
ncbi:MULTISPECIES: hypothetical protein [Thermomonospora]|uniref:OmpW family protein n=1 Tax=Thermomonospora curvata (strain ATCC 19995 / DSM 43183 / JCM 3096 / KCTC 9072 / NBRC 15933 / NCIMB 10081 / Henssen B9) TaxID=471852 RepID=D1A2H7_THECD|nr:MULTISPECIES: hypothetical protein [Thermomonospora]ACY95997.1 hypothetical protein Tcur_0397 [Thermomonospora curvata DSM 43183]PKK16031.1 MAG: hypothetical protein BUE48_001950 [Thermomonospora sp. CIF 1]